MNFFGNNSNNSNDNKNESNVIGDSLTVYNSTVKKVIMMKVLMVLIPIILVVMTFFVCFVTVLYVLDHDNPLFNIDWSLSNGSYLSAYTCNNCISVGAGSALFDNSYTKQNFVAAVNSYNPPSGSSSKTGKTYQWGYDTFFKANAANFFDIATSYGIDPRFIFAIGLHESAYGTSRIALEKGNFFGWGAYDSSPYSSALTFYDMSNGISTVCKGLYNNYVNPNGSWYNYILSGGYSPSSIEGIGYRYASDPSWANGVKTHMENVFGKMVYNNTTSIGKVTSSSGDGYTSVYTSSSGRTYKEFKQNKGSYASLPYASGTISGKGCSITSVAIVVSGYGFDVTPGRWTTNSTYRIEEAVKEFVPAVRTTDIGGKATDNMRNSIVNHLKSGKPVIVHFGSGNVYTEREHWMALLDVSGDGSQVYVSNPGSVNRTGWDSLTTVLVDLRDYILVD